VTADLLVPVRRPDGRLYRPRKLVAFMIDEEPEHTRALVLGTHDVVRATKLAKIVVRGYDRGYEPVSPLRGWWRSGIRNHMEWFEPDERRGRAGVMFEIGEIA
jgi:hypothetical protein